jgi:hypothetical protein
MLLYETSTQQIIKNFRMLSVIWHILHIHSYKKTRAFELKFIKLKLSHCTPPRRLGEEEVQLLLILDLGIRMGVSDQRHAPAAL